MRKLVVVLTALVGMSLLPSAGCGGDDDDAPPPPTTATGPAVVGVSPAVNGVAPAVNGQPTQVVATPTGQVMVTVAANSNPPGAIVTGGGRQLGLTPLQTQVPVPAPVPGQVQTFSFTFELAGYQPATINASPVNNTISITAALAPAVQPQEVGTPTEPGEDDSEAGEIRVVGQGGGPIYDNHVTTGTANVDQDCTIDRLRVRLNGNHTFHSDLHISLRDPSGNSYSIQRAQRSNPFRSHTVRRAVGRQARGRWTLAVDDRVGQDSGVLRGWSMSLRCR